MQISHWEINVFIQMNNIWKLSLRFHCRLRANLLKNMHFKCTFPFCFVRYCLVNSAIAVLPRHAHLLTTFDPGLTFFFCPFLLPCYLRLVGTVERSYRDNHQPRSSFSAIQSRNTCIMTENNILF